MLELFAAFALFVLLLLVLWIARAMNKVSQPGYQPPSPNAQPSSTAGEKLKSKTFYTKVAGVTKKNDDGERRQSIVKDLDENVPIELAREPDNPYDSNAIRVDTPLGTIGYIPADVAANDLAGQIDRGYEVSASISALTGGETGKRTRGVNLEITVRKP